jgi:hypothetical protein
MVMASWIWPATRGKKKAGDDVVDRPSTLRERNKRRK